MLLLKLIPVLKRKASFRVAFRDAFCSDAPRRFAMAFAWFGFSWKFVNNMLRIYRKKSDKWNGFISGAIAGLAIQFEHPDRRMPIAQQLFVRGAQTLYDSFYTRNWIDLKHGSAWLFALCSGQLLYNYVVYPQHMPAGFYKNMVNMAQVPHDILQLNRENLFGLKPSVDRVRQVVQKYGGDAALARLNGLNWSDIDEIPCEVFHPRFPSCTLNNLERFVSVFRAILPVYLVLNLVPVIVFKYKQMKNK